MPSGPYASAQKLWFDTFVKDGAVGTAASGYYIKRSLNLIPQNAGSSGRRGSHIRVLNLNMHGMFHCDTSAIASFDADIARVRLRFIVYYDTSNNSDPTRVDPEVILASNGTNATVDSFRNMVQAKDFKILYDKIITLEPQSITNKDTGGTSTAMYPSIRSHGFRISKKLNLDVDFTEPESGDPTLSNIPNGNFGILAFNDGSNTGSAKIDYCCRLKYSTNWPWN